MFLDPILNGSADLILADFSITAERSKKGIEFSLPFMTVGHTLMGRKAEKIKVNILILEKMQVCFFHSISGFNPVSSFNLVSSKKELSIKK